MSEQRAHVLVIGAGSVGKRHLRNLAQLGCLLSVADPREDRLAEAAETVPLIGRAARWQDALAKAGQLSGVVICSPPTFHVEQALAALEKGVPVFLEKPVSADAESAARLGEAVRATDIPLLLGYSYRWWPPVQELKRRLERGVVGAVRHVRITMSAHLEDWHPWERYQEFFMASRALGGGALLDESHFIDLMLWYFGPPTAVFAQVERLSALEIETDDNVDAVFSYPDGKRVVMHLDLYGRPHERSMTIVGEQGTLQWSYEQNCLRLGRSAGQEWEETRFTCERNEMFLGAAKEFLRLIETRQAPSCSIEDGHRALQVIEAMRDSAGTGRVVAVGAEAHA